MDPLSRRRFLTISGATIAVAPAAACGRSPVTAGLTGTPERGVRKVATFCDEKMQAIKARYGPEAVALFSHGIGGTFLKHTLKAYGSPNIAARSFTQCHGPRDVGFQLTFGEDVGSPERTDIRNSRCLVLIGSHLGENMHNTQVQELADGVGSGATVIVVDPRFSIAAGKAKYYLPIKPGTDLALLLAWMNVLVAEQLWLSHREPMPTFQQFRGAGGQPPSREEIEKRMKEMRAAGPPPLADVQLFVSDHEKVGGVLLPRTVRRAVDGTTEELQLTKLQVNPAFKADKFEKK